MAIRNDGLVRGKHIGKGLTVDETRKKIDVAVDGTTVSFTADGKLKTLGSGGLDCAAIDQLPEVSWKKNTVVLGKQDGNCVRLKATGDIFTDVVLSLSTAKTSTSIVTGTTETINLVAQVQNAGTNPATAIRLVLTKPLLGTYTMGTPVTQLQGATNFVKVSDTEYTIETLSSGGVATVTIPVTYSKQGTFTFGGQVTSTIDTDTKNNSKTVTVSVTEQVTSTGGNYVPTQDCPLFTITDLQYNKQLFTFGEDTVQNTYKLIRAGTSKINIYADKRGLAGRRFRLTNAEQIVCVSSSSDYNGSSDSSSGSYSSSGSSDSSDSSSSYSSSSRSYNGSSSYSSSSIDLTSNIAIHRDFTLGFTPALYTIHGQHIIPTSAYTYNKQTGELVFNRSFTYDLKSAVNATNVGALVMYVKPAGQNCKWQCCVIKFSADFQEEHPGYRVITHTSALDSNVTFTYHNEDTSSWYIEPDIDKNANWVGGTLPADLHAFKGSSLSTGIRKAKNTNVSVVVAIKSGTNGTFTLTATDGRLSTIQTRGNILTSYNAGTKTLTVTLANPQPQNSIKFTNVEFKVIDQESIYETNGSY